MSEGEEEIFVDLEELRKTIPSIRETLLNRNELISKRFRSIFTLRNLGGPEAIEALSAGIQISHFVSQFQSLSHINKPLMIPRLC